MQGKFIMNLQQLFDSWKTKSRPNVKWKMAGDMPGRLDWLVSNFSGLDSITEFGSYQGCSTAAWLMCKPKKLIAVDWGLYLDTELYGKIAKENNIYFEFIHSNDLEIDIDPTDLLFIDTKHTEEHTYLELKKHAIKAKKYIAFHDVNPARFATPLGIKKYLDEHPGVWKEYYRDEIDCGFLVLQRI